jgi:hypothetical protein
MTAKPTQAPAPAAKPAHRFDRSTMIGGAAVLALLIIGIAAFAMMRARRRRREEQEWADEQSMAYEPFETATAEEPMVHDEQPAMVAPAASAFAWGNDRSVEHVSDVGEISSEDDRRPGETWVERAYRGPSPANPSVSLRTRLKRAAFFDKRERDAAAGLAEPVDPTAGLPDAMTQEQDRELA